MPLSAKDWVVKKKKKPAAQQGAIGPIAAHTLDAQNNYKPQYRPSAQELPPDPLAVPKNALKHGVEGYVATPGTQAELPADILARFESQVGGVLDNTLKNLTLAHYQVFKEWPNYSMTADMLASGEIEFATLEDGVRFFTAIKNSYEASGKEWQLDAQGSGGVLGQNKMFRDQGREGFTAETDVLDPEMIASFKPKSVDDLLFGSYMKHDVDGKSTMFRESRLRMDEMLIELPKQWAISQLSDRLGQRAARFNPDLKEDEAIMKGLNTYLAQRLPKEMAPVATAAWQDKTEKGLRYLQMMRASALYVISKGEDGDAAGFLQTKGFSDIVRTLDEQIRLPSDPTGRTDAQKRAWIQDWYVRTRNPGLSERQAIHELGDLDMTALTVEGQQQIGSDHLGGYAGAISGFFHDTPILGGATDALGDVFKSDEFHKATGWAVPIAADVADIFAPVVKYPLGAFMWGYEQYDMYWDSFMTASRTSRDSVLGLTMKTLQLPFYQVSEALAGRNALTEYFTVFKKLTGQDSDLEWVGDFVEKFKDVRERKEAGLKASFTDDIMRDIGISPETHPELAFLADFAADTLRDFGVAKIAGVVSAAVKTTDTFVAGRKLAGTVLVQSTIADTVAKEWTRLTFTRAMEKKASEAITRTVLPGGKLSAPRTTKIFRVKPPAQTYTDVRRFQSHLTDVFGIHTDDARNLAQNMRTSVRRGMSEDDQLELIRNQIKGWTKTGKTKIDPDSWGLHYRMREKMFLDPESVFYRGKHPHLASLAERLWKDPNISLRNEEEVAAVRRIGFHTRTILKGDGEGSLRTFIDMDKARARSAGDLEMEMALDHIENAEEYSSFIAGHYMMQPELAAKGAASDFAEGIELAAREMDLVNPDEAARLRSEIFTADDESIMSHLIMRRKELWRDIDMKARIMLLSTPANKKWAARYMKRHGQEAQQWMDLSAKVTGGKGDFIPLGAQHRRWMTPQIAPEALESTTERAGEHVLATIGDVGKAADALEPSAAPPIYAPKPGKDLADTFETSLAYNYNDVPAQAGAWNTFLDDLDTAMGDAGLLSPREIDRLTVGMQDSKNLLKHFTGKEKRAARRYIDSSQKLLDDRDAIQKLRDLYEKKRLVASAPRAAGESVKSHKGRIAKMQAELDQMFTDASTVQLQHVEAMAREAQAGAAAQRVAHEAMNAVNDEVEQATQNQLAVRMAQARTMAVDTAQEIQKQVDLERLVTESERESFNAAREFHELVRGFGTIVTGTTGTLSSVEEVAADAALLGVTLATKSFKPSTTRELFWKVAVDVLGPEALGAERYLVLAKGKNLERIAKAILRDEAKYTALLPEDFPLYVQALRTAQRNMKSKLVAFERHESGLAQAKISLGQRPAGQVLPRIWMSRSSKTDVSALQGVLNHPALLPPPDVMEQSLTLMMAGDEGWKNPLIDWMYGKMFGEVKEVKPPTFITETVASDVATSKVATPPPRKGEYISLEYRGSKNVNDPEAWTPKDVEYFDEVDPRDLTPEDSAATKQVAAKAKTAPRIDNSAQITALQRRIDAVSTRLSGKELERELTPLRSRMDALEKAHGHIQVEPPRGTPLKPVLPEGEQLALGEPSAAELAAKAGSFEARQRTEGLALGESHVGISQAALDEADVELPDAVRGLLDEAHGVSVQTPLVEEIVPVDRDFWEAVTRIHLYAHMMGDLELPLPSLPIGKVRSAAYAEKKGSPWGQPRTKGRPEPIRGAYGPDMSGGDYWGYYEKGMPLREGEEAAEWAFQVTAKDTRQFQESYAEILGTFLQKTVNMHAPLEVDVEKLAAEVVETRAAKALPDAQSFIDDWNASASPETIGSYNLRWGEVHVNLQPNGFPGEVVLNTIANKGTETGAAGKVLDELLRRADDAGITIKLTASPYGKSKGKSRAWLEGFYRDRGFRPEIDEFGEDLRFRGDLQMERKPRVIEREQPRPSNEDYPGGINIEEDVNGPVGLGPVETAEDLKGQLATIEQKIIDKTLELDDLVGKQRILDEVEAKRLAAVAKPRKNPKLDQLAKELKVREAALKRLQGKVQRARLAYQEAGIKAGVQRANLNNALALVNGGVTRPVGPDDVQKLRDFAGWLDGFVEADDLFAQLGGEFNGDVIDSAASALELLRQNPEFSLDLVPQPAREWQLQQMHSSGYNYAKLSKFMSGGVIRKAESAWANKFILKRWSIDDMTTMYKTIVMAKISTMLRIPLADEFTRFITEGINPLEAMKDSRALRFLDKLPEDIQFKFSELIKESVEGDIVHIAADDKRAWMAYRHKLVNDRRDPTYGRYQAGKELEQRGTLRQEVEDWLHQKGELHPELESVVNRFMANGEEFKAWYALGYEKGGGLHRTGFDTHRIMRMGPQKGDVTLGSNPGAYAKEHNMAERGIYGDSRDLVNSLVDEFDWWNAHDMLGDDWKLTRRLSDEELDMMRANGMRLPLKDDVLFKGEVSRMNAPSKRGWRAMQAKLDDPKTDLETRARITPALVARKEGGATGGLPAVRTVRDTFYKLLDYSGAKMNEMVFSHTFTAEKAALKADLGREFASEAEEIAIERQAAFTAREYTQRVMFNNATYMGEDLFRNIFMFLPAYRQFLQYWVPQILTKPMVATTAYRLNRDKEQLSKMQVGGYEFNLSRMTFLINQGDNVVTGWLPSGAPLITMPVSLFATQDKNSVWGNLAGTWPFEFSGAWMPLNSPIDKMFYGATGATLPWPFGSDGSKNGWREVQMIREAALRGDNMSAGEAHWKNRWNRFKEGGWNFLVPIGMRANDEGVEAMVTARQEWNAGKTPAELQTVLDKPENATFKTFIEWQNKPSYEQLDFLKNHPEIVPYMVSGFEAKQGSDAKVSFLWSKLREMGVADPTGYTDRLDKKYTMIDRVIEAMDARVDRDAEYKWWDQYAKMHGQDHDYYRIKNNWENSTGDFAEGGALYAQGKIGMKAWQDRINTKFVGIDDPFYGISNFTGDAFRFAKLLDEAGGPAKKLLQMSPNYEMYELQKLKANVVSTQEILKGYTETRMSTRLTDEQIFAAGYNRGDVAEIQKAVVNIDRMWDAADIAMEKYGKYGYATTEGRAIRKKAILTQNGLIDSSPLLKGFLGDNIARLYGTTYLTKPVWERADFVKLDDMDKTEREMFYHLTSEKDPVTHKVRWDGLFLPEKEKRQLEAAQVISYVPVKKNGEIVSWRAKVRIGDVIGTVATKAPPEAKTIELSWKQARNVMQQAFESAGVTKQANDQWRKTMQAANLPTWAEDLIEEGIRAEGWTYYLKWATKARKALRTTINEYYDDTPGFSLQSKFGLQWKKQMLNYGTYLGRVSPLFGREYRKLNGNNEMINSILGWYL